MVMKACLACGGTGQVGDPAVECGQCRGFGQYDADWVGIIRSTSFRLNTIVETLDDLTDRCNDIMDKCNDIFEKVSETLVKKTIKKS